MSYISRAAAACLTILIVLSSASCGRKSDLIPPGTLVPAGVTDLVAQSAEDSVVLAWTRPARNTDGSSLTDLAGFTVLRAEGDVSGEDCLCEFGTVADVDLEVPDDALVRGGRIAWTDRDPAVVTGRRYAYKVVPYNHDGYPGPESNEARLAHLTAPSAPAGLSATPGDGSTLLSWDRVETDTAGQPFTDLAGYNVYRSTSETGVYGRPLNREPVAVPTYMDDGLENNTDYYYRVTAVRGGYAPYSEGAGSSTAKVVPSDVYPPTPPEDLRAVPGDGFVLLSWLPSVEPDIAGYMVYRKEGDGPPVRLTEKPFNRFTYRDEGVSAGVEYTYTVTAVDDAAPPNESGMSAAASVTIPASE